MPKVLEAEWGEQILTSALDPLLAASATPHKIIGDFAYTANIRPNEQLFINGTEILVHRVETTMRGRRVLPPAGKQSVFWISLARDESLLYGEFSQEACLFREVVDLDSGWDDAEWRAAVVSLSSSRIVLDGATIEATTTPPSGHEHSAQPVVSGLIRWYFSSADITSASTEGQRRSITLGTRLSDDGITSLCLSSLLHNGKCPGDHTVL